MFVFWVGLSDDFCYGESVADGSYLDGDFIACFCVWDEDDESFDLGDSVATPADFGDVDFEGLALGYGRATSII